MAYCEHFLESDESKCKEICRVFVKAIKDHFPEYAKKVKIHLILHLVDCMISFGPTSAYNTERLGKEITVLSCWVVVFFNKGVKPSIPI